MLKQNKILAGLISLILVLTGGYFYYAHQTDRESVIFFDVGQGDASLIMLSDDYQILIDGGPDQQILEKLGQYMPFYDNTIELVILTHPHSDHVSGLVEVLQK